MTKPTHHTRWFVIIILASVFLGACNDKADKARQDRYQIAIIEAAPVFDPLTAGFKVGMADLGFEESKDVEYTVIVSPDFSLTAIENEVLAKPYDLVLVVPAGVAPNSYVQGIRELLPDTPLIFVPGGTNPVVEGYADTLERPGKNITGILLAEADERRFELFLDMLPDADKLVLVYEPTNPTGAEAFANIRALATEANVELVTFEVAIGDTVASVEALAAVPDDADAIFLLKAWDVVGWLDTASRRRLPISVDSADVEGFYVMSYGPGMHQMGLQAAGMVSQVINGVSASDLPIETTEFVLTVNLGAADAIALSIPDTFLEQANVILRDPVELPPLETVESNAACNASLTTFGQTYRVCVSVACADLTDTQFLTYADKADTSTCATETLVGICSTSSSTTYYYAGDAAMLETGCGFQSGVWQTSPAS